WLLFWLRDLAFRDYLKQEPARFQVNSYHFTVPTLSGQENSMCALQTSLENVRADSTQPIIEADGNAVLYLGDCFSILPQLRGIDAVVTDPPYCIGYKYRSYDDSPSK